MPTSEGLMLTSRVGAHTSWRNLLTVVAGAMAPFGRWNTAEEMRPVGRDGSGVRKALNVAPVSLTADGIVPLNMPFIDGGCQGNGAVWEVEYRRGKAPSWKGWV